MRDALRAAIEIELKAAKTILEKAKSEGRDPTSEELDQVQKHTDRGTQLKAQGEREDKQNAQMKDLATVLGDKPAEGGTAPEQKSAPQAKERPTGGAKASPVSLGQAFIDSPAFKDLLQQAPAGGYSQKSRVHSQLYRVEDSLLRSGAKALPLTGFADDSAGALIREDYRGFLSPFYERPLKFRQLVTNGSTTSDLITYAQMDNISIAATVVPEAVESDPIDGTTITDVIGGLKPQSEMTFTAQETTVKTIAHWMAATKQALADASQIRTLIDNFLRYGVEEVLEDQMIGGAGGTDFTGIANTSGIQTQTTGADMFVRTRQARRKVRIGGRANPTAYVFNPIDWETIQLLQDGNNQFYGNGPFGMGPDTLWGLPVVESEAVPAGTAYCADWRQAVLYDREAASIQVTDSHADFFTRNLVAILCELRAAFAVLRPSAFVKITVV